MGGRNDSSRNPDSPSTPNVAEKGRAGQAALPGDVNFSVLVENSLDAIAVLNGDGTIRYESPSVERVLGYRPEELIGKSVLDFIHPDDVQGVAETFEASGADPGQAVSMEVRFLHKDGSWRAVEGIGSNLLDDPEVNGIVVNYRDITERKQMEEALRESEERFRSLIENSSDVITVLNADGTIRYESPSLERVLGYSHGERTGENPISYTHPDDMARVGDAFAELLRNAAIIARAEARSRHKDGSWRTVEFVGSNQLSDPAVRGIVINFRDVTERKQLEEAALEAEKRYRAIFETRLQMIYVNNEQGLFLDANDCVLERLGYTRDDLGKLSFQELLHADDVAKAFAAVGDILTKGFMERPIEVRLIAKSGETVWVETFNIPLERGVDSYVGLGMALEITERKHMETQLKESEEKLQRYLNGSPDVIVVTDLKGTILYINDAGERLIGYTREEFIGNNFLGLGLLAPGHKSKPKEWVEAGGAEKAYSPDEFELIKKDGTRIFTEVSTLTICPEGDPAKTEIIAIVRDISERKRMEQVLRESEEQYSLVVANVADAVFKYKDGSMTWANDRIEEMLGYTKEEIIANDVNLFVSDDVSLTEVTKEVDVGIKKEGHFHGTVRARKKDGTTVDVEYTASMVQGKEPPEIVGIARDVTERRRAEAERERLTAELAEKNEEQEQIIYVTSHDLRSPLVNVQGFSRELEYSLQELTSILESEDVQPAAREKLTSILESDVSTALSYIRTSISKMDTLLSGLLRLSRLGRSALNFEQLNMGELLSDIEKAFEYRIKEAGVKLEIGDLPPCQGDAVQINQIFSNLLDNALKYLDPERPGIIAVAGEMKDGEAVYCVEDNGIGIAGEHQKKVFEIFHRLNPADTTGEGLGLSIIRKILSRHNGSIWVESEAGAGSRFYVSLPVA